MSEPRGELLHFPDGSGSLFLKEQLKIALDELVLIRNRGLGERQSVLLLKNLAEEPGVAQRTPTNHNAVTTRFRLHPERIFRSNNIPIPDDWYLSAKLVEPAPKQVSIFIYTLPVMRA